MKVRTGFVSNSSSSSFCIYGTFLNGYDGEELVTKKLFETLKAAGVLDEHNITTLKGLKEAVENYDVTLDDLIAELKINLVCYTGEGEYAYIGAEISEMKDDETKAQFQQRIKDLIGRVVGKRECDWHAETINS